MSFGSIAKKLGLSLGTLAALLIAGELVARSSEPGPMSLFDSKPYLPHEGVNHVHKPDFEGRWDGTWYDINSRGWRGPEFEPTFGPEELRVVALGDSCTFGKGVNEDETWPRVLEQLLNEELDDGRHAIVANLGVNGYSSRDYEFVFNEQGAEVLPNIVVLGYNLNDFPNLIKRVDRAVFQGQKSLRAKIPWRLRENLGQYALYRWMRSTYYHMNRERDWSKLEQLAKEVADHGPKFDERFQPEAERLQRIVDAAHEVGAEVVIFLFPYESMVYLDSYSTLPVDRVREISEQLDVTFVSLADTFREAARQTDPPKPLFLRGDRYHPNPDGYRIVAENLLRVIRENHLLDTAE